MSTLTSIGPAAAPTSISPERKTDQSEFSRQRPYRHGVGQHAECHQVSLASGGATMAGDQGGQHAGEAKAGPEQTGDRAPVSLPNCRAVDTGTATTSMPHETS